MHRPLPQHLPALDGLRGVAALMVLVSHSANAGFLPTIFRAQFGPLGVALFYLLSGFLMTHLAVRSSLSRENLRNYAVARLARVLPLFYLALLVAAPASLFADTGRMKSNHWKAIGAIGCCCAAPECCGPSRLRCISTCCSRYCGGRTRGKNSPLYWGWDWPFVCYWLYSGRSPNQWSFCHGGCISS
jgi:hypothetical protein